MQETIEAEPTTALEVHAEPVTEIGGILRLAVEKNVSIDTIERLVALMERSEARNAAMAFNVALASFKSECPPIRKTSRATITSGSGGQYSYNYAELDEIDRTTRPLLTKFGLSYSWDMNMEDTKLSCVCTLRHVEGHAQTAQFITPTTALSKMSDQQKVASALTYAKRQSLIQVLGLTTTDPDNDGADERKIDEAQAHTIQEWIDQAKPDMPKFLEYMRVEKVSDIRARDFQKALTALKAKARKGGA